MEGRRRGVRGRPPWCRACSGNGGTKAAERSGILRKINRKEEEVQGSCGREVCLRCGLVLCSCKVGCEIARARNRGRASARGEGSWVAEALASLSMPLSTTALSSGVYFAGEILSQSGCSRVIGEYLRKS